MRLSSKYDNLDKNTFCINASIGLRCIDVICITEFFHSVILFESIIVRSQLLGYRYRNGLCTSNFTVLACYLERMWT